ncbi:uncharacterized protein PAC_17227 [Phialocephala subalpina]|uniref:Uncharacterized protein n=1 Tax=Phialocephala subalpina TaxID=576137 RepID=A0A1L7XQU5_9HELO|nr:uncharacterized protein PAC_17227 [Phialocephala subalpina]
MPSFKMSTSRYPTRNRAARTTKDGLSRITSDSMMMDMCEQQADVNSREQPGSKRPRRSNTNYGYNKSFRVTKKRNTTPQLASEGSKKLKRLSPKPATNSAPDSMELTSWEQPEVEGLINGQTPINQMRLKERTGNGFAGMQSLTRSLSMLGNDISRNIRKAMDFVDWFKQETIPGITTEFNDRSASPAVQSLTQTPPQDLTKASGPPSPPEEPVSSSYVNVSRSDYIGNAFENEDRRREFQRDSSAPSANARGTYHASRTEASPPPLHGYPTTAQPYQPNVPLPDAIRRDDSALVLHQKTGHLHSTHLLWDTGSNPNFISYTKARELGCAILPLPEKEWLSYETVNSNDVARHYVLLEMLIRSVDLPKLKVYLLIVDSNSFDIILGHHFIGEYSILQKLVAKGSNSDRACAIISKKATPEQIEAVRAARQRRELLAQRSEFDIQSQRVVEAMPQQQRAAASGSTESSSSGAYGGGPRTTVNTNSSFGPAMCQSQNPPFRNQRMLSTTESYGSSSMSSSSFRQSFDRSTAATSFCESPTTTFSIAESAETLSSNLERSSMKSFPHRVSDRLKSLGKGKGKGDKYGL